MEMLFLAMLIGGLGLVSWAAGAKTPARAPRVLAAAERTQLDVEHGDQLAGERYGISVRQRYESTNPGFESDWVTHTSASLPRPLPPGFSVSTATYFNHAAGLMGSPDIQLGNDLDDALFIRGPHAREVVELLTEPAVDALLRQIVTTSTRLDIPRRFVELHTDGDQVDHAEVYLDLAANLANTLSKVMDEPWDTLVAEHNLTFTEDGNGIIGTILGQSITAEFVNKPVRKTVITAHLIRPLPERTYIRHPDHGNHTDSIGDPILDSMLAISTSNAGVLADRLSKDDIRGLLLEVVHAHPGSTVTASTITFFAPGRLNRTLKASVQSVAELAAALA